MSEPRVRVIGVDPGSLKAGWGIVDVERSTNKMLHVDNGVIVLDAKAELPERIVELSRRLHEVLESYRPAVAAVEDVFVQRGARSALVLGQARGAMLATLGLCGIPVASHTTSQVKSRVAGHGRAAKEQVAEMVTVLLGLKEHPFEDAADALAVALCHGLDRATGAPSQPPLSRPAARSGRSSRGGAGARRKGLEALARAQGKL
jgi:crossover junction endodeoxyribonuclease RuvC